MVTELPKFASIESLYFEIEWEPFHFRRHSRKFSLFCKIRNNDSPLYLYDCLVPFISEEKELKFGTENEFRNPLTRLWSYAKLFSLLLLNHVPTLNRFKQAPKKSNNKTHKSYNTGCRILNIMHTRLRDRSSNMNANLFHVNLANDPGCLFMHSDVPPKFHEKRC